MTDNNNLIKITCQINDIFGESQQRNSSTDYDQFARNYAYQAPTSFDEVFFYLSLDTDENNIGKILIHYEDERIPQYLHTGPYKFNNDACYFVYASKTIQLHCNLVSFAQKNKMMLDVISRSSCQNTKGGYYDSTMYRMRVGKW